MKTWSQSYMKIWQFRKFFSTRYILLKNESGNNLIKSLGAYLVAYSNSIDLTERLKRL